MLLELKVTNFAIIENIQLQFGAGFNVISGETGSGKTILLKSLGLLMGAKASSDTVRTGCEQASIEGFFDLAQRFDIVNHLKNLGFDAEEKSLIVRRVISAQGKSRVYLNGHMVTLADLKEVVSPLVEVTGQNAPLIEMTGQHDNRQLQEKNNHLDILDHFAGLLETRQKYSLLFKDLKNVEAKISNIESNSHMRAQRIDYLKFQSNEISELNLAPGDEIKLEAKIKRQKSSANIYKFLNRTEDALNGDHSSAMTLIHRVLQEAENILKIDPSLTKKIEPLKQAKSLIEEVLFELAQYANKLNLSEDDLGNLEAQLSQLRKLQNKFGASVEEIIQSGERIHLELLELENTDSQLLELQKQKSLLKQSLMSIGTELHKARLKAAKQLSSGTNKELLELNMKGLTFDVQVVQLDELSPKGITDVEFLTQTSKSDKPRPLAKFASGGELSRILLSIKNLVGNGAEPRTYLFDEVDAGVSGETAEKVGKKLKAIAKGQQVICVTHLPQVAAFADLHFLIEKAPHKQKVNMMVRELTFENRVEEIARLISGEKKTKTSLQHAKVLLDQSQSRA